MSSPTPVVVLPKINWTDPAAVTSYIASVVAAVVGFIVVLHPGWTEPSTVQAVIPAVGFLIAGGVQVANLIMHRKAQIALLTIQHEQGQITQHISSEISGSELVAAIKKAAPKKAAPKVGK